jgi:hypothetical protein
MGSIAFSQYLNGTCGAEGMVSKQLHRDGVARLAAAYGIVTAEQQDASILADGRSSQAVVQVSITGAGSTGRRNTIAS